MIKIKGIIGEGENRLISIIAQANEEQGNIHVLIDSIGGDLDEGISIFNYLKSLGNVTTECVNNCASAASIIFLAGAKRIAGCPIMIHNPWAQVKGSAEEVKQFAEFLAQKEKELEQIYADNSKVNQATLSNLMDNETYISPSQAISLGFATEAKLIALAKLNKPIINKSKGMNKKGTIWDKLRALAQKVKAMELTTATGETLTIKRDEGEPQIGDEATPDGVHTLPDGVVITVSDGVITDIVSASNEGDEALTEEEIAEVIKIVEELAEENEELEKENEELKEEIAQAKAKVKSEADLKILNAVKMAGGEDWLAKQCSHYKPQARVAKSTSGNDNPLSAKLQAIKAKRGIN